MCTDKLIATMTRPLLEELQVKYLEAISVLEGKSKQTLLNYGRPCTREKLLDVVFSLKDIYDNLFALADKSAKEASIVENASNVIVNNCMEIVGKKVNECLPSIMFNNGDPTSAETNKLTFAEALKSHGTKEVVKHIARDVVTYQNKETIDRNNRERNIIVFNMEENVSNNATTQAEQDETLINEVLSHSLELTDLNFQVSRVGRKPTSAQGKPRPVKIVFENLDDKIACLSNAYKLKDAEESHKKLSLSHDLTTLQREELKGLLSDAKAKNEAEKSKNIVWKVRGSPTNLHLVQIKLQQPHF